MNTCNFCHSNLLLPKNTFLLVKAFLTKPVVFHRRNGRYKAKNAAIDATIVKLNTKKEQ